MFQKIGKCFQQEGIEQIKTKKAKMKIKTIIKAKM